MIIMLMNRVELDGVGINEETMTRSRTADVKSWIELSIDLRLLIYSTDGLPPDNLREVNPVCKSLLEDRDVRAGLLQRKKRMAGEK